MELKNIPVDVNYDDGTMTCWNGQAFVTWEEWRFSTPVRVEGVISEPESSEIDRAAKILSKDQQTLFSSQNSDDYLD